MHGICTKILLLGKQENLNLIQTLIWMLVAAEAQQVAQHLPTLFQIIARFSSAALPVPSHSDLEPRQVTLHSVITFGRGTLWGYGGQIYTRGTTHFRQCMMHMLEVEFKAAVMACLMLFRQFKTLLLGSQQGHREVYYN